MHTHLLWMHSPVAYCKCENHFHLYISVNRSFISIFSFQYAGVLGIFVILEGIGITVLYSNESLVSRECDTFNLVFKTSFWFILAPRICYNNSLRNAERFRGRIGLLHGSLVTGYARSTLKLYSYAVNVHYILISILFC